MFAGDKARMDRLLGPVPDVGRRASLRAAAPLREVLRRSSSDPREGIR
jgi:hypothetical protein